MANLPTVTATTDQETALTAEAAAQGITLTQLLQAEVNVKSDALLESVSNSWWNSQTAAEKKVICDANQ